jgi:hypothetical protein
MDEHRKPSEMTMGEIRATLAMLASVDPESVLDWQVQLHVHATDKCQLWSMSSDNPMEV